MGPLAVSDLLPAMRMALSELKPGQISPVLKVPGSFVFMQLLESSGKSGLPLQQVREEIRAKLEKEATEKKISGVVERVAQQDLCAHREIVCKLP